VESAAESDDKLLESYFAAGELTEEQLKKGLYDGILKGSLLPVFCGSADKNIGAAPLLDFICDYGPRPFDAKNVSGVHPDSKSKVEWGATAKDPLCAFVFKTLVEAHVGNCHSSASIPDSFRSGPKRSTQATARPKK